MIISCKRITKTLISLRGCASWSAPVFFANPRRQIFSRRGPIIIVTSGQENARLVIARAYSDNINICYFVNLQIHNSIDQKLLPGCLYTFFYMDCGEMVK